jgi:signal transduction histidine kinase
VLADQKPVRGANGPWGVGALSCSRPAPGPLAIAPGRGELEFLYTALDFQAPEDLRFKYKLEDVDADWVDAGTRRTAHYSNVYPGKYRFQIIACNRDGLWNTEGASITLVLRPHLWQTWWYRALGVLLVVGAASGTVLYFARRRMKRKLQLLEQRHAIERERGRIAKDIHDDLGSSLTRILMLGERAVDGASKPDDVTVQVGKIVTTARGTIQALDEIVWAVNPENDTLEGLVEYISHYADEFFENTNVACRLEIPVQLPRFNLSAEVRHDLFLIVKEAFNNILKHSRASEVHVEVSAADSTLEIRIEDNGCGFDATKRCGARKGNGFCNMRKRTESLGGQFTFTSAPGKGTRISITTPLTPNHSPQA